jgi:hypothetical protein
MAVNIHTMIPHALNISQFAEFSETIKMLYEVDEDFKTLCDDYTRSKTSFEEFKDRSLETKQMKLEYKRLSRDLEKEILDYVTKRK